MSNNFQVYCWYTPDEWAKVKAISSDGDTMGNTFDGWLKAAERETERLNSIGATVDKVHVDADALLAFASSINTNVITNQVRVAFALSRHLGDQPGAGANRAQPLGFRLGVSGLPTSVLRSLSWVVRRRRPSDEA